MLQASREALEAAVCQAQKLKKGQICPDQHAFGQSLSLHDTRVFLQKGLDPSLLCKSRYADWHIGSDPGLPQVWTQVWPRSGPRFCELVDPPRDKTDYPTHDHKCLTRGIARVFKLGAVCSNYEAFRRLCRNAALLSISGSYLFLL